MERKPDARLTIKGVQVDAWISCYSFKSFGRERPKFHLTVTLTFPNRDWEKIVKPEWLHRGDWFYSYKTNVAIVLRIGPLNLGIRRLPTNWEISVDAFKYVDGGGRVCNKTYPDECRFVQKKAVVDAVVGMFEDDPGLYRRLVAADFDRKVDGQREDVAKARAHLDLELKELEEILAYSKRFRPKDVPKVEPTGEQG